MREEALPQASFRTLPPAPLASLGFWYLSVWVAFPSHSGSTNCCRVLGMSPRLHCLALHVCERA